jgi:glycosyltransferase involved in cell wall biosynthesis
MRLVIAANSDLCFDQRLLRISRSLLRGGIRPYLLGRRFPGSPDSLPEEVEGTRIVLNRQKGKAAYLELNLRLLARLLVLPADAICSVDLDTLPACVLAGQWRSIPVFHDAHEYMEQVPEVYNRPLTRLLWETAARTFLPFTRMRYTVSQSLCLEFEQRYGLPFALVRNMAETPDQAPVPAGLPKPGYWVFLGAVNQGRGLEEFLPCLLHSERPLVVAGDGDVRNRIEQRAEEMGLSGRVYFTGKINPGEAAAVLQNAFAGINLLTGEGLSYRYSLANKFFDYVQAGIPQICIGFPEYRHLMARHQVGELVENLGLTDLLAAIIRLENPDVYTRLRENALQAARDWNWKTEEKNLLDLYRSYIRE